MPLSNLFISGGVVMWPLLGLSILAMALILERVVFWFQVARRQDRIVREVLALYRRSARSAFQKLEQNADLPVARIFLAALELDQATPEEFRLALESSAQAELPLLKRFNTVFETVISVAPLLGLLGTILGLINSFAALRVGDVSGTNTAGVTGGISEALIATASGLVVAIFTLLFANMFRGLYLRQIALIQEYGGQLELLYRRRYERRGTPPMRLPNEPETPFQINIVPLIDVIFAVLTFFMVSTLSLTRSEGLPVNLPGAVSTETQTQQGQIVVTIDRQGELTLDRQPVELDALESEVRSQLATGEPSVVVINADRETSHGQVVAVMDRLRSIQGIRMAIATQRP